MMVLRPVRAALPMENLNGRRATECVRVSSLRTGTTKVESIKMPVQNGNQRRSCVHISVLWHGVCVNVSEVDVQSGGESNKRYDCAHA